MPVSWHDLLRTLDPTLSPRDVAVRRRSKPLPPAVEFDDAEGANRDLHDISIEPLALLGAALGDAPHACAILNGVGVVVHILDTPGGVAAGRGWVRGARLYETGSPVDELRAGRPVVAAGDGSEELLVPLSARGTGVVGALALACNPAQLPRTAAATILATAQTIALATQLAALRGENERVLGTIGHELRQPLSALVTALDLGSRASRDAPANALRIARRQTQQIMRLVDALLDASRLSRGKLRIARRLIDLRDVVRDGADSVRADAEARHQQFQVRTPERAVWCAGDPARLQQVVVNLVTNASRYTPEGGTIEVSLAGERSRVRLTVADTGDGLEADARERIFQPFTHTRSSQGLGLGLAISRAIAELHGGTLTAESSGRGGGSVFTLELPGVLERTREVREAVARTRQETRELIERARMLRASLVSPERNQGSGSRRKQG
jgi:signal transduction histidine kinase